MTVSKPANEMTEDELLEIARKGSGKPEPVKPAGTKPLH